MSDLVAFLNCRLDEDEAKATAAALSNWFALPTLDHPAVVSPLRQHREVEVKRNVLAEHARAVPGPVCRTCADVDRFRGYSVIRSWPCDTVRLLAAVYSSHPDYQQEWA